MSVVDISLLQPPSLEEVDQPVFSLKKVKLQDGSTSIAAGADRQDGFVHDLASETKIRKVLF